MTQQIEVLNYYQAEKLLWFADTLGVSASYEIADEKYIVTVFDATYDLMAKFYVYLAALSWA